MQGSSNGPLATFLMLVPLVAVPLLAIFGVPQFSPLAASPSQPGEDFEQDRDFGIGENARFAEEKTRARPSDSDKTRSRGPSSTKVELGRRSSGDSLRRFIPREETPEYDPFLELDRATEQQIGNHRDARERESSTGQPENEVRDVPGWVLDESFTQTESQPEQQTRDNSPSPEAREPWVDEQNDREFVEQPRNQVEIRANNSGEDSSGLGSSPSERVRGSRRSPQDDTSRFFNEPQTAETATNQARSSGDDTVEENPFAKQQAPSSDTGELVATLGSHEDHGDRTDALARVKRGVEVATERIERRGPLTWKKAVQQLNGLGIRQYQLQPGQSEGEFHFSCAYALPDASRVTRRFEAEATEPLRAVEKVLTQIEEWMVQNGQR